MKTVQEVSCDHGCCGGSGDEDVTQKHTILLKKRNLNTVKLKYSKKKRTEVK